MKLNFAMFKSGTAYWVIGGIILFIGFYYITSKGGGSGDSSGAVMVSSGGPSEGAQLQMAQLSAQVGIAQGQITSQTQLAALESQTAIALATMQYGLEDKQSELSYNAALAQMANDRAMNTASLEYTLDSARVAAESTHDLAELQRLAQKDILDQQVTLNAQNTGLLAYQLATSQEMFEEQLRQANISNLIGTMSKIGKTSTYKYTIDKLAGQLQGGPAIVPISAFMPPPPATQG